MRAGPVTIRFVAMRLRRKRRRGTDWPKVRKPSDRPPTIGNKRLAEQTRKILGKHYASKYRVR